MDPYDLYMEQQEDWQNEISKKDDRIKELERDLDIAEAPYVLIIAEGNKRISELGEDLEGCRRELRKRWERIEDLNKEKSKLIVLLEEAQSDCKHLVLDLESASLAYEEVKYLHKQIKETLDLIGDRYDEPGRVMMALKMLEGLFDEEEEDA